jgi:hypothetical protein
MSNNDFTFCAASVNLGRFKREENTKLINKALFIIPRLIRTYPYMVSNVCCANCLLFNQIDRCYLLFTFVLHSFSFRTKQKRYLWILRSV